MYLFINILDKKSTPPLPPHPLPPTPTPHPPKKEEKAALLLLFLLLFQFYGLGSLCFVACGARKKGVDFPSSVHFTMPPKTDPLLLVKRETLFPVSSVVDDLTHIITSTAVDLPVLCLYLDWVCWSDSSVVLEA